jgi:uncharacterized membrane protein YqjE
MANEPSTVGSTPKAGWDESLGESIRSLGDSLARLLSAHVALARVELRREGERLLRVGVLIAVGLLWACAGYLVLMGALVALLSQPLGVAPAAALVGATNVVLGGAIMVLAIRRLGEHQPSLLKEELHDDVELARRSLSAPVEPEGR